MFGDSSYDRTMTFGSALDTILTTRAIIGTYAVQHLGEILAFGHPTFYKFLQVVLTHAGPEIIKKNEFV